MNFKCCNHPVFHRDANINDIFLDKHKRTLMHAVAMHGDASVCIIFKFALTFQLVNYLLKLGAKVDAVKMNVCDALLELFC